MKEWQLGGFSARAYTSDRLMEHGSPLLRATRIQPRPKRMHVLGGQMCLFAMYLFCTDKGTTPKKNLLAQNFVRLNTILSIRVFGFFLHVLKTDLFLITLDSKSENSEKCD